MTDLQLLDLCQRAYDHADIEAGPHGRDGASVTKLPGGEIVVAFRGTLTNHDFASFTDWLNDFRAELVTDGAFTGRVHAGFRDVFRNLWPRVNAAIDGTPLPQPEAWYKRLWDRFAGPSLWDQLADSFAVPLRDKRLIFTGHSLGGILAQYAGWITAHFKPRVVCFASPLGGDSTWAMDYPYEVDLTLYQASDDIVPYLPPYAYRQAITADVVSQGFSSAPDWMRPRLLQARAHQLMADLLDPFKRAQAWTKVKQAHHLDNYRAWLASLPDNSPPAARAA